MKSVAIFLGCFLLVSGKYVHEELKQQCVGNTRPDRKFMVENSNCQSFVNCDEVGVYHGFQDCPWGTLFDETKQTCEHKEDVNCRQIQSRNNDGCENGAIKNNCTAFHWCVGGVQKTFVCPGQTIFSQNTSTCVWPTADDKKRCNLRD